MTLRGIVEAHGVDAPYASVIVGTLVSRGLVERRPPGATSSRQSGRGAGAQAWRRAAISRRMSGVKISCMASSILPPGTTMMLGRDMNESCSIDSR
jgi:hypothetical protein